MAAPTLVATYESNWSATGTSKNITGVAWQSGDLILVKQISDDAGSAFTAPTNANLTFAGVYTTAGTSGFCETWAYSAVAGSGQTAQTVVVNNSTASGSWGGTVEVWRGSAGIGATAYAENDGTADQVTLTTSYADSAISAGVGDWSAGGTTPTWLAINGTAPTVQYTGSVPGQYDYWSLTRADAGAAGAKVVGASSTALKSSVLAIEVRGTGALASISLRAAGTATAATVAVTAVNPSVPTGATTGDLSVLTVWMKPFGTTITTPSGWTKIGEETNGTLGAGTDTGSTKVAVYVRESATVGAIGALTLGGSPNSVGAVINTYAKDPTTTWDYSAFTTGGDTTNGANYSATGAAGISVATGDWVSASTAVCGDIGTVSAQAIGGMSGATLGTIANRTNSATTTGTDTRGLVSDIAVSSGSSTAAPTFTYTNASFTSGTTLWLRLRQVASGTQYNQAVTASSVTITGSESLSARKILLDTVASTATDAFAVTKSLVDSVTTTASETLQISKTLLDQIVATAVLSSSKVFLRELAAACSSTGTKTLSTSKALLDQVTSTASRVQGVSVTKSATSSILGSRLLRPAKVLSDAVTSTGSMLRASGKSLLAASSSTATSTKVAATSLISAPVNASGGALKSVGKALLGTITATASSLAEKLSAPQTYYQALTALVTAAVPGGDAGTPVNLFSTTPNLPLVNDGQPITLGTEFYVTSNAWLTGVRYLHGTGGDTAARTMAVYSVDPGGTTGTMVAGPFTMPTPTGGEWCSHTLDTPYQLTANTRYRVAYFAPGTGNFVITGEYFRTGDGATTTTVGGILVRPNKADSEGLRQGSFNYGGSLAFPGTNVNSAASYYADVEVTDSLGGGGGLIKSVSKALGGAVSSTALRVSSVLKGLTGSATGTSSVVKAASKPLSVTVTGTGSLNVIKSKLLALTASVTSSATARRAVSITRSTSRTVTATVTKAAAKTLSATSTGTGTLAQLKAKFLTLAPTVAITPTMRKAVSTTKARTVTVSGSVLKRVSKTFSDSVAITPSLSSTKVFLRALSASVAASATARRAAIKPLTAAVSSTPSMVKRTAKTVTDQVTSTAALLVSATRVRTLTAVSTAQASAQRLIDLTVPATIEIPASFTKFIDVTVSATTSIIERLLATRSGRVVYTPPPTIEIIPEDADTAVFVGGLHGPTGPAGPRGPVGAGVPAGGVVGDVLKKVGTAAAWAFQSRVITLAPGEPIPAGTPRGTIVLRRVV